MINTVLSDMPCNAYKLRLLFLGIQHISANCLQVQSDFTSFNSKGKAVFAKPKLFHRHIDTSGLSLMFAKK